MLAVILGEPGSEQVRALIRGGACVASTVNISEVVAKLAERGASREELDAGIGALGVAAVPFIETDAFVAGMLRSSTRAAGLSFADRACIALAVRLDARVVTADRGFQRVQLPIPVELVRSPQVPEDGPTTR